MSHSILGKLFAVCIIIFYSTYDVLYGIIVCFIVAIYYQTIFIQGKDNTFQFSKKTLKESFSFLMPKISSEVVFDPINTSHTDNGEDADKFRQKYCVPFKSNREPYSSILQYDTPNQYSMFQYVVNRDGNSDGNDNATAPIFNEKRLEYKGQSLKKDNIAHIFPELTFLEGEHCNPCSNYCRFSVSK